MKKIFLLLPFSITLFFNTIQAQTPTWAENIAPIMFKSCTGCHHPGGAAPFSLMTYKEAKQYKTSVHHAVSEGNMPPWPPDVQYSQFAYQRALPEIEKQALLAWANGTAPEGNPANAPTPPQYSNNGFIPNPDLRIQIPTYNIATTGDDYRCFPVKSGLSVDKFITQLECLPGNGSIVHHILIYQDQSNKCFELDAKDAVPG